MFYLHYDKKRESVFYGIRKGSDYVQDPRDVMERFIK